MRFFILIALVASIVYAEDETADLFSENFEKHKIYITECEAEFKVTNKNKYDDLRTGGIAEADADETMKCFINCLLEKYGFLKDGKFQEDATIEIGSALATSEELKIMKESCHKVSGSGKCETAMKLHECFLNNLSYVAAQALI